MVGYDSYKPSGIPWVGDIPSHWEVKRNKHLLRERKAVVGKNAPRFKLLSLTLQGVILRDMENPKGKFPAEFDTYKQVSPDDLIFCLFDVEETPRTVGLAKNHGMITGAYTVTRANENVSVPFLYYYYLSLDEGKKLRSLYTGLRNVITREMFFSLATPLPPREEQDRIVTFLSQKTADIDAAIKKKERLIELLQEKRDLLLNKAVTTGLRGARLQESELDWMGMIPEHWKIKPLKHLLRSPLKYGANEEAKEDNRDDPRYIRITDFGDDGELRDETYRSLPFKKAMGYFLSEGDILFARSGATVGKTFFYQGYSGRACYAGYLIKAEADRNKVLPSFLYAFTKSLTFTRWRDENFSIATIQNIGADKYSSLKVCVPPLDEQQEIVAYVEALTRIFGKTISSVTKEISTLQEMKTTVVSNVVTGKIRI